MAHAGFQQFPYTVTYGMAGAGHSVIDVHTAFLYVGTYRRSGRHPAENEPPLGAQSILAYTEPSPPFMPSMRTSSIESKSTSIIQSLDRRYKNLVVLLFLG